MVACVARRRQARLAAAAEAEAQQSNVQGGLPTHIEIEQPIPKSDTRAGTNCAVSGKNHWKGNCQ